VAFPLEEGLEEVPEQHEEVDEELAGTALSVVERLLEAGENIVIVWVDGRKNLYDYARAFKHLAAAVRASEVRVRYRGEEAMLAVVVIDTVPFPKNPSPRDLFNGALDAGLFPVVAVFTHDFAPLDAAAAAGLSGDVNTLLSIATRVANYRWGLLALFTTSPWSLYSGFQPARHAAIVRDPVSEELRARDPRRHFYMYRVGFVDAMRRPLEELEAAASAPAAIPASVEPLERDASLGEMVIPQQLKDFIYVNIVRPLSMDFESVPSLMLLGLPGSGKSTLAYCIARALGVPAYTLHLELTISKWLGESEKNLEDSLAAVNAVSPSVLVIPGVEELSGSGEDEGSYERMKSVLSKWIRGRKRFFPVIAVSNPRKLRERLLVDPSFGAYKVPLVPPLREADRRAMLSLFASKLARAYRLSFSPDEPRTSEALDHLARETWLYTPRELHAIARAAVNVALAKGSKRLGKDELQQALSHVSVDRVYRAESLRKLASAIKKIGVPQVVEAEVSALTREVESLVARAAAEEARKRMLDRLRR